MKLKIVFMNCLKSKKRPYICIRNPTVVNKNHPTIIIKKPEKNNIDPKTLLLRQKKIAAYFTPTNDIIPIVSEILSKVINNN